MHSNIWNEHLFRNYWFVLGHIEQQHWCMFYTLFFLYVFFSLNKNTHCFCTMFLQIFVKVQGNAHLKIYAVYVVKQHLHIKMNHNHNYLLINNLVFALSVITINIVYSTATSMVTSKNNHIRSFQNITICIIICW